MAGLVCTMYILVHEHEINHQIDEDNMKNYCQKAIT